MPSPEAIRPGIHYHIFSRGINREDIFLEERNYAYFLNLYAKYILPVADTYAYCLMKNHFHLLVRIKPEDEIITALPSARPNQVSLQFSKFLNAYAKAINTQYGRVGSLFQHPFGREPVVNSSHFERAVLYIHFNPQKHGFVDDFKEWPHTSYRSLYAEGTTHLMRSEVMEWFGNRKGYLEAHRLWKDCHQEDPKGLRDL